MVLGPLPRHLREHIERVGSVIGWPEHPGTRCVILRSGSGFCTVLDEGGSVWVYDVTEDPMVGELPDGPRKLLEIKRAIRHWSALADWLPQRPTWAVNCPACDGRGYSTWIIVPCSCCSGLGWVTQSSATERLCTVGSDEKCGSINGGRMVSSRVCPHCGQAVSAKAVKCSGCGGRIRYKTAKEAYGTWGGMGLFDLIPGVRDLPTPLRLLLLIVVVGGLVWIIIPLILG
jgi:hypothetical protein